MLILSSRPKISQFTKQIPPLTKTGTDFFVYRHFQIIQDSDLIPILHSSEIPTVIHGTYFKNWTKIKTEGLSRMRRLHIHFSTAEACDSQVINGMRSSCQLYIYIDAEKALRGKNVTLRTMRTIV
jgi:2'-phosphotransferase